METFNFDKLVLQKFAFLLEAGFEVEDVKPTLVRFSSALYEVRVFYGPRTREVDLEVKSRKHPLSPCFSLNVLIGVFDKNAAKQLPVSVPVTTRDGVESRIEILSRNFRRHVKLECLKSPTMYERLNAVAKEIWRERYPNPMTLEESQAWFDNLWENKEYEAIQRIFEPLREHLTDRERSILDYVKQALKGSENPNPS